jgi:PAS domain S-box-containing protein
VGAALVRRLVGFPIALETEREILKFVVCGGPIPCLINATFAVSVLTLVGIISWKEVPFNWWTWWIGDSIGVLVVAPLLIVFTVPQANWPRRRLFVGLPILIGFSVIVLLFLQADFKALSQEASSPFLQGPMWQTWTVLALGMLFLGSLGIVMLVITGRASSLQRWGEQFRIAIDAAPTGMIMVDDSGQITLVNAQTEALFGYSRQELFGRPIELLLPHRFRKQHVSLRESYNDKPSSRPMGAGRDLFGLRKDGTEFPVEVALNPIKTAGGKFILSSIVDIADRKRAEQEREDLLDRLRAMNSTLEERVRLRTAALTETLGEREILLQEVHHRVKNNLQVISSLINMQMRRLTEETSRTALQECQTRVQAIALIHEKLYQSKNYSGIPFPEYVRSLAGYVFQVTGASPSSISMEFAIEDVSLAVDKAIPCALILNELITNALKHAFPDGRAGKIRIELARMESDLFALAVKDDGVGLSKERDHMQSQSLGMQLVNTLTSQLSGNLSITQEQGTSFQVVFPQ